MAGQRSSCRIFIYPEDSKEDCENAAKKTRGTGKARENENQRASPWKWKAKEAERNASCGTKAKNHTVRPGTRRALRLSKRCKETCEEDRNCLQVSACLEGRNLVQEDRLGWVGASDLLGHGRGPQTYWVMGGPSDLLGHGRGPQTYWVMGGALRLTGSWEGPSDLLGHGRGPQTYWVMGGALRLTGSWEGPSYFLGHGRAFRLSGSWEGPSDLLGHGRGPQTYWVTGGPSDFLGHGRAFRLSGSWEGPSDLLGHGSICSKVWWLILVAQQLLIMILHLTVTLLLHSQLLVPGKGREVLRVTLTLSLDQTATQANWRWMSLKFSSSFFQTADAVGQCFFVTTATMWVRCWPFRMVRLLTWNS